MHHSRLPHSKVPPSLMRSLSRHLRWQRQVSQELIIPNVVTMAEVKSLEEVEGQAAEVVGEAEEEVKVEAEVEAEGRSTMTS
jgi:PHP family Zn ribbon phosphoesterase